LNPQALRVLVERLLVATAEGSVALEELGVGFTGEAVEEAVGVLGDRGLVGWEGGRVVAGLEQRLGLATLAVELGGDVERVARALGWLEFEELASTILGANGYSTRTRFRFQAQGRRWEVDVLGWNPPYLLAVECKHYGSGMGNSAARRVVEAHLEKAGVLSENPQVLKGVVEPGEWVLVPLALTLHPAPLKLYRRVAAVPVFNLPSFLEEFPGQLERLAHFTVRVPQGERRPHQLRLPGFRQAKGKR